MGEAGFGGAGRQWACGLSQPTEQDELFAIGNRDRVFSRATSGHLKVLARADFATTGIGA